MDNSRFKFRAWFPDWKEMHILSHMNGALLNGDMELMTLEVCDELVNGEHEQHETWTEQPSAILMQYTGLKDKNGKDIYESDILSYSSGMNAPRTDVIKYNPFDNHIAGFQVRSPYIDIFDAENIEIIGNIHENPELLEGGK